MSVLTIPERLQELARGIAGFVYGEAVAADKAHLHDNAASHWQRYAQLQALLTNIPEMRTGLFREAHAARKAGGRGLSILETPLPKMIVGGLGLVGEFVLNGMSNDLEALPLAVQAFAMGRDVLLMTRRDTNDLRSVLGQLETTHRSISDYYAHGHDDFLMSVNHKMYAAAYALLLGHKDLFVRLLIEAVHTLDIFGDRLKNPYLLVDALLINFVLRDLSYFDQIAQRYAETLDIRWCNGDVVTSRSLVLEKAAGMGLLDSGLSASVEWVGDPMPSHYQVIADVLSRYAPVDPRPLVVYNVKMANLLLQTGVAWVPGSALPGRVDRFLEQAEHAIDLLREDVRMRVTTVNEWRGPFTHYPPVNNPRGAMELVRHLSLRLHVPMSEIEAAIHDPGQHFVLSMAIRREVGFEGVGKLSRHLPVVVTTSLRERFGERLREAARR